MAVKPITNTQVVNRANINRGEQVSTKNLKDNVGNRQATVIAGKNLSKNYAVTLKDVDTAILAHVKDVMRPSVREANENIKVSVMYGNEERWSNVRKRGVMRDINGSLILPLIMLRRTSVDRSTEIIQNFEHDVKREHTQVVRSNKWSKDNRYSRFGVQFGQQPVLEQIVTTMPNFVNINYEFILWTGFIEQMNPLVESFVEQNYTYWGNSTDYKFLSTTDSITDASEMTVDGERLIRSTFTLITKAYLLPSETNSVVTNRLSQTQRKLTTSRVVFGLEGNATDKQVGK